MAGQAKDELQAIIPLKITEEISKKRTSLVAILSVSRVVQNAKQILPSERKQ
jgi:hypothetical protein